MTYEQANFELLPGDRVSGDWTKPPMLGTVEGWKDNYCFIRWDDRGEGVTRGHWGPGASWNGLTRLDEPVRMTKDLVKSLRVGDYLENVFARWDVVEVSMSGDVFTIRNRRLGHTHKTGDPCVSDCWLTRFNLVRRRTQIFIDITNHDHQLTHNMEKKNNLTVDQLRGLRPGDKFTFAATTYCHAHAWEVTGVGHYSVGLSQILGGHGPGSMPLSDLDWFNRADFTPRPLQVGDAVDNVYRARQLKVGDVIQKAVTASVPMTAEVVSVSSNGVKFKWSIDRQSLWSFDDVNWVPNEKLTVISLASEKKKGLHLPEVIVMAEELGGTYPKFNASTMRLHIGSRIAWTYNGGVATDFGTVTRLEPDTFTVNWEGHSGGSGERTYRFADTAVPHFMGIVNNARPVPAPKPLKVGERIVTAERARLLKAGDIVRNVSNGDPKTNLLTILSNKNDTLTFDYPDGGRRTQITWGYVEFRTSRWGAGKYCGELEVVSLGEDSVCNAQTPEPVETQQPWEIAFRAFKNARPVWIFQNGDPIMFQHAFEAGVNHNRESSNEVIIERNAEIESLNRAVERLKGELRTAVQARDYNRNLYENECRNSEAHRVKAHNLALNLANLKGEVKNTLERRRALRNDLREWVQAGDQTDAKIENLLK
jgi:hypothetical protein